MPAFIVSRATEIDADTQTVFARLRDFSTWRNWSPWMLADPDTQLEMLGDPADQGGGYRWESDIVGAGEMRHVALSPPKSPQEAGEIRADLRFLKPWKSQSEVSFFVTPVKTANGSTATRVQWDMKGSLPLFLFFMKKMLVSMVGMDYDRGLRMLKEWIETDQVSSHTRVLGLCQTAPRRVAGLPGQTTLAAVGEAMEKTIGDVHASLSHAGICTEGQWLSLYDDMNLKTTELKYTCAMELPEGAKCPSKLIEREIPSMKAMHVSHVGRYETPG